jgi:hypothetical protein
LQLSQNTQIMCKACVRLSFTYCYIKPANYTCSMLRTYAYFLTQDLSASIDFLLCRIPFLRIYYQKQAPWMLAVFRAYAEKEQHRVAIFAKKICIYFPRKIRHLVMTVH